jgi:hypothetical protein
MPRLTIAQPEAVQTLVTKVRRQAEANPDWWRLSRATARALQRYAEAPEPNARGFYHGLLTGYAVALKALQGKVLPLRRV